LTEARVNAPATPDSTTFPKGLAWGIPRLAAHGWALALALLVLVLAPLAFPHPIAEARANTTTGGMPFNSGIDDAALRAPSTPAQAGQLSAMVHYTVKPGDSVDNIAARAGITADTLVQINGLSSPPLLTTGGRLLVPPIDGTLVRVDPDQSLSTLATTFRVDISALRTVNALGLDARLPRRLFIPAMNTEDVTQLAAPPEPGGNRQHLVRFAWPAHGTITQYFWDYHPGIDIANEFGTPEAAADAGQVVFAGWGDYGIYVEIDHGNGFHTIYAHMSAALVAAGQRVAQGQRIGLMGATGRATGPHLHFEVRYQGVPQNPIDLLS
jgi:murein DD-endopeptidase MepM/ murein hydrolase activator NlpD